MFTWLKKKDFRETPESLTVDIHSHLLPGLDDGVQSLEEAEAILLQLQKLGYKKIITTPHVMGDTYRNSANDILEKAGILKAHVQQKRIAMQIDVAAEYYLDEYFVGLLESNQKVLTFGSNYLLFETNFINEPLNLKEFIFLATTKGYKLIMAHPERYLYIQSNFEKVKDLLDRGVLFQVNISSLSGYYSKPARDVAHKLIERGWVHFLGTDCHHIQQIKILKDAQHLKDYKKALKLSLLNNTLA